MKYLGYIQKMRLKTFWEEGTVDRRLSGPMAQWDLLIECGKGNWIGLKSENPPTVHYYRKTIISTAMLEKLMILCKGKVDIMDGEIMAYCPLNKLPELCKIVRAKVKRKGPPKEVIEKGLAAIKKINEQVPDKSHPREQG